MRRAAIAVLVSGGGTNLQALIDAQAGGDLKSGEIRLVVSSRADAYALERARTAGIEALTIVPGAAFEEKLTAALERAGAELIILAGFLSMLSGGFTRRYEGRIINVHPSLIPAFCGVGYYGLRVHRAVLAQGVKITGATVHYVNEIPDGGEIIAQRAVEVLPGDTPELLQERVMRQAEWVLLPAAAEQVCRQILSREAPSLERYLGQNPYPGRGILLGRSPGGAHGVIAYFIMGRSENSRNRVFAETLDGIRTLAYEERKLTDPSLVIYHPVRRVGERVVVTNGDQTDTVRDCLLSGGTFGEALSARAFEPDGPNWTPRISGLMEPDGSYRLAILKSADAQGSACLRQYFEYPGQPGAGHLLHTYAADGDPLPSFRGEPVEVAVPASADALAGLLWDSLNPDNKISLYVCYTDLATGARETRILNKHGESAYARV
ncbi:MAG TPA: phosphoribosylglycinamide formyltransferase [Pseudoflavonifractor sp.]|nr:phosphoribosylglycinamide formyltransferase [Pseudoflavonifractor sp.]